MRPVFQQAGLAAPGQARDHHPLGAAGQGQEQGQEIPGRRLLERQALAGNRMVKGQPPGVQQMAGEEPAGHGRVPAPLGLLQGAVGAVAHDGVAQVRQVYPNLVGAAGEDAHGQERGPARGVGPEHAPGRARRPAALVRHGHAHGIARIAADGGLADARGEPGRAVAHGQVLLGHLPVGERPGQGQAGGLGEGDDQEPGGVLVQAVHHPGPLPFQGSELGIGGQDPGHQGAHLFAGRGVHREARGLVEHQEGRVLVHHVQVPGLRGQDRGAGLHGQAELVALGQAQAGLGRGLAVHRGLARLDPLLDPGAGHALPGQPVQHHVQPLPRVVRVRNGAQGEFGVVAHRARSSRACLKALSTAFMRV